MTQNIEANVKSTPKKLVVVEKELVVYRISSRGDGRSMWYDRDANFDPLEKIFEDIPMPEDMRKKLGNGDWLSSVDDPELFKLWFPNLGKTFEKMNFVAQKLTVQEWARFPNEIVFNRESAVLEEEGYSLESLMKVEE